MVLLKIYHIFRTLKYFHNVFSHRRKVFSRIKNNSEVILKCDIESNEYLIIDQILEYSNRIKDEESSVFSTFLSDKQNLDISDSMKQRMLSGTAIEWLGLNEQDYIS